MTVVAMYTTTDVLKLLDDQGDSATSSREILPRYFRITLSHYMLT